MADDRYGDGYKAGYAVGYGDGQAAGYSDAKNRAHLALRGVKAAAPVTGVADSSATARAVTAHRDALKQVETAIANVVGGQG